MVSFSPGASRCHPTATASLITLLLCGDVESNPGPRPSHKSIYPCGYCQLPVDYGQKAQCCDTCDVWFHHTCIDMSSRTYSSLTRNSKVWYFYRCNSINSSIYHEYEYTVPTRNSLSLLNLNLSTPLDDDVFTSPQAQRAHSSPVGKASHARQPLSIQAPALLSRLIKYTTTPNHHGRTPAL